MKIKCPICKKQYDTEKANHYTRVHDDLEIGQCLTDLVFKIHEKIEQIHPNESFESWKKATLKSLLENEK